MCAQAVTASAIKQERALKKKKMRKRLIIGGGVLVFIYLVYLLFVPHKGSITYGVCKTFLELQVPYPHLMRLSSVDDFGAVVRVWYTQVDSFGEYRLEALTCTFKETEEADNKKYGQSMPFVLQKATIGKRDLSAEMIEKFNYSLPSIITAGPNLEMPSPLPDSLKGLQINSAAFLKPIF